MRSLEVGILCHRECLPQVFSTAVSLVAAPAAGPCAALRALSETSMHCGCLATNPAALVHAAVAAASTSCSVVLCQLELLL